MSTQTLTIGFGVPAMGTNRINTMSLSPNNPFDALERTETIGRRIEYFGQTRRQIHLGGHIWHFDRLARAHRAVTQAHKQRIREVSHEDF